MATIVNTRDVLLQSSAVRFITDNTITIAEKPGVISRYNAILSEKASIDELADQYTLTVLKGIYDSAISTLTAYLATLTTPVLWNNLTNYTLISTTSGGGAIFRSKFDAVDTAKFNIRQAVAATPKPTDGADGAAGVRGSQTLYIYGTSWSDAAADAATTGPNVLGDTVTISDGGTYVMVKTWSGSAWVPPGVVIDGNLIVSGSVTAAKINANALTIRDAFGNIIFNASAVFNFRDRFAGATTNMPENDATVGANWLTNFVISPGAITSTYINSLAADKISVGVLNGHTITTNNTSGQRITINSSSDNALKSYNSSGTLVASIGEASFGGYVYAKTTSSSTSAIVGESTSAFAAIQGSNSSSGTGVFGSSSSGTGLQGSASSGTGVVGSSTSGNAASFTSTSGSSAAVIALNNSGGHAFRGYGGGGGGSSAAIVGLSDGRCFYNESGTFGPFTGAHDSIIKKTDDIAMQVGDIILDTTLAENNGISDTIFVGALSSCPNQKNVLGVLNTRSTGFSIIPAAFIDKTYLEEEKPVPRAKRSFDKYKDTYDLLTVNAVGEGQINVCGQNGNIEQGDFIVTSGIPGKGMKQSDDIHRNYTVAKARESVTFNNPMEVKTIACFYLCG